MQEAPATLAHIRRGPAADTARRLRPYAGWGHAGTATQEYGVPDQWWRFISALFLQSGLVQLLAVVVLMIRSGWYMDRDLGSLRLFAIFMVTGVSSLGCAALFAPLEGMPCACARAPSGPWVAASSPPPPTSQRPPPCACARAAVTTGSSGPIMGMLGVQLVDIVQNWKLIVKPVRTLLALVLVIVLTLVIGLLPYNNNWSNLGGLLTGIPIGLILAPKVSERRNRKVVITRAREEEGRGHSRRGRERGSPAAAHPKSSSPTARPMFSSDSRC